MRRGTRRRRRHEILFIKLIGIGEADDEGRRNVFYELNGMPRESQVLDKSLAPKNAVTKPKGDAKDPLQVVAPMPGMVASIAVSVGQKVKEGETLLTLEAMKMFAAVASPTAGTVSEICVKIGESVESKDLLVRLVK